VVSINKRMSSVESDCLPSATEQKILELVRRLARPATSVDSLSDRLSILGEVLELAIPIFAAVSVVKMGYLNFRCRVLLEILCACCVR
jgi:hypothetical protein